MKLLDRAKELWGKMKTADKITAVIVVAWVGVWIASGALGALLFGAGAAAGYLTGAVARDEA